MNTVNPSKNLSIQGANSLQTRAKIFIANWPSYHNHKEIKEKPIQGMNIRVDAIQSMIDVTECIPISQIQQVTMQDGHLQW